MTNKPSKEFLDIMLEKGLDTRFAKIHWKVYLLLTEEGLSKDKTLKHIFSDINVSLYKKLEKENTDYGREK